MNGNVFVTTAPQSTPEVTCMSDMHSMTGSSAQLAHFLGHVRDQGVHNLGTVLEMNSISQVSFQTCQTWSAQVVHFLFTTCPPTCTTCPLSCTHDHTIGQRNVINNQTTELHNSM